MGGVKLLLWRIFKVEDLIFLAQICDYLIANDGDKEFFYFDTENENYLTAVKL